MLLIITSWVIIYFLAFVVGFGAVETVWPNQRTTVSRTEIVLMGLTGIVAIVQAASIVMPADFRIVGGLVLLAVLVNWRLSNRPVQAAVGGLRRLARQPLVWLLMGVILIFSINTATNSDSGLYHIPAIRWYERFWAIPGLGNLHGRLAFNSSFFVVSAAFGFTAVVGQTLFSLNSFLLLVFGAYVIQGFSRPEAFPGLRLFRALLLALALYYLLYQISSPTPDVWATLLPLFIVLFWLDGVPTDNQPRFALWIALLLLCLTVKLGTVPLLLFLPIYLGLYWRSLGLRQGLVLVALGTLIVGPWLVRNVILSGYLIYPFPALDLFSVDWKIPLPAVQYEQDYVTFWGRFHIFEAHLDPAKLAWPLTRWVPVWWQTQGDPKTYFFYKLNRPLLIAAAVSPLILIVIQSLQKERLPARLWAACAIALGGFLFWFIKAPEFRFGLPFIWTMALLPWIPLLGRLPQIQNQRLSIAKLALGLLLLLLGGKFVYQQNPVCAKSLLVANWYGYREQQADGVRLLPHETQAGLVVLVPDPIPAEQRCYEVDQLCSPYLFDDLEKRGPTLESGFRRRSSLRLSTLPHNIQANEVQRYYPRLQ